MDSLEDVRAAIAELDRRQKKLINQIKYAERTAEEATLRARNLRVEIDQVQDRWLALIAKEREMRGDDE